MQINEINALFFSPTQTTRKTVFATISEIRAQNTRVLSLPKEGYRFENPSDLCIFASPTYGGRIPRPAAKRIKKCSGKNNPAVLIALYGNNKFGDVLAELSDLATERGFVPVAAAAFAGEHSFSTEQMPIAAGRPDVKDLEAARTFGRRIQDKIIEMESPCAIEVPGISPKKPPPSPDAAPPETDTQKCTLCKRCQTVCPTAAITVLEPEGRVETERKKCIYCCACTRECPQSARTLTDPALLKTAGRLHDNCSERREPSFYLD